MRSQPDGLDLIYPFYPGELVQSNAEDAERQNARRDHALFNRRRREAIWSGYAKISAVGVRTAARDDRLHNRTLIVVCAALVETDRKIAKETNK